MTRAPLMLVLLCLLVGVGCSGKGVAPDPVATALPEYVGTLLADARIISLGGANVSAWQARPNEGMSHAT